jgi:hypothetical protein
VPACSYRFRICLLHIQFNKSVSFFRKDLVSRNEVSICVFIFNYAPQPLRLIARSWLNVPTFATRRLHACHHARAPSGGRWNCGREMSGKFCLNADSHVTFRDLLRAVKLRHGTDGFTSPPKEGVLRFLFRP